VWVFDLVSRDFNGIILEETLPCEITKRVIFSIKRVYGGVVGLFPFFKFLPVTPKKDMAEG
jgi:hypothetical protein